MKKLLCRIFGHVPEAIYPLGREMVCASRCRRCGRIGLWWGNGAWQT